MLARLTPQKRLTDAIAAFERVVAAVPDARLDIFGDGPERERLQDEITRRGLAGAIALHGYDPRAHERLWRSSAFLLTSAFEGYPLSTLESMSHGCPVVGYDIKYGPREQITDGVDGFLVAQGDVDGIARRVVELLESPELVRRMGEAGRRAAQQRGPDAFLARWAGVLQDAIDRKPYRTAIEDVAFELSRLRLVAPRRFARPRKLTGGPVPPRAVLELEGVLTFKYERTRAEPTTARLRLEAIDDATGAIVELPAEVTRRKSRFEIRAAVPVALLPAGDGVWLRLLLTWQNSSWQTRLPLAAVR
jgi:poly(glycerol-phosphate) alpha-glucosyltransferase